MPAEFRGARLIRERTRITAELLERLPALRMISLRSEFPHVDGDACIRLGMVSSNLYPGSPSVATAELTWGLVLAAMRRIPQQMTSLRAGRWQESVGHTLGGKTLRLFGYDRITEVVAGYGRTLGMSVLVWESEESQSRVADAGLEVAGDKRALFERSDVLSVHLRLVAKTRRIVTFDDLAREGTTSLFVNTSRAGRMESGGLLAVRRIGRPGISAIDVFDEEPPLDADDPLVHLDNVVCTPPICYVTRDEWKIQFRDVFGQAAAYAVGDPVNVVNPKIFGLHLRRAD